MFDGAHYILTTATFSGFPQAIGDRVSAINRVSASRLGQGVTTAKYVRGTMIVSPVQRSPAETSTPSPRSRSPPRKQV